MVEATELADDVDVEGQGTSMSIADVFEEDRTAGEGGLGISPIHAGALVGTANGCVRNNWSWNSSGADADE